MPRDFFQYLVKVCRVFVAADLAGGINKAIKLRFTGEDFGIGGRSQVV